MTQRFVRIVGGGMFLAAGIVLAQAPVSTPAKLEFEVASIKPAQPLQGQMAAGKLKGRNR